MNTNIFDFQNSESTMQFNPLFLPANNFVENPGIAKSFKLSSSSYLFSDIIKVFTGTTDLTKNLDSKLIFPSDITSKQIPSENIFSVYIADNNNLSGLVKELSKDQSLSSGLKELFALISKLSNGGQIKSLQNENDNLLTSDGLKAFLNELNNLVNGTGVKENSSNVKNKNDKDSQELISKILDSLKNGAPVIINIVGKTETLKIELINSEVQKQGDILTRNSGVDLSELGQSIKESGLNSTQDSNLQEIAKNPGSDQITSTDTADQNKQTSNRNAQNETIIQKNFNGLETDKIENLLAELGENKTEMLKEVKIPAANSNNKTASTATNNKAIPQKSPDSLKFLKENEKAGGSDAYKLKFEIVDNENMLQTDKNSDVNKNSVMQNTNSAKSNSDSLTIENLVASKSSLKNINKISNQQNNNTFKNDVQKISNAKTEVDKNSNEIKTSSKNFDDLAMNQKNEIARIDSNVRESLKSQIKNDLNGEATKVLSSKYKIKNTDLTSKQSTNPLEKVNNSDLNEGTGKEIKVTSSENQSVNQKEIISNSHPNNIETDNTGKININNSSSGNNFSDYSSNRKQDVLNNSKNPDHVSNDQVENTFSSYLNKFDVNNIKNIQRPAFFNSFNDQMKTIDSSEVVKEISKLASDKDQRNIVLKLIPETLGKVKISLNITNNIIHAHAEVENEAAKFLMQNNIENLKQALVQQGMQLNSLNISLSNHQEQKSNRSYLSKRKSTYTEAQIGEIDEKEHTNVSKHFGYNTYEFLA